MTLPVKTVADIRALNPSYDPANYLPRNWRGTALDLLHVTACPVRERLWIVLRRDWIDDRTLREFAEWCNKQVAAPCAKYVDVWAAADHAAWHSGDRDAAMIAEMRHLIKMLEAK